MPVLRTNAAHPSVDLPEARVAGCPGNRGPRSFKSGPERADGLPMSAQPRDLGWTQSSEPLRVDADGVTDYTFFSDEQLSAERDRQQAQLDELKLHSGDSLAVRQLRAGIEREVTRMTDELDAGPDRAPVVTAPWAVVSERSGRCHGHRTPTSE